MNQHPPLPLALRDLLPLAQQLHQLLASFLFSFLVRPQEQRLLMRPLFSFSF